MLELSRNLEHARRTMRLGVVSAILVAIILAGVALWSQSRLLILVITVLYMAGIVWERLVHRHTIVAYTQLIQKLEAELEDRWAMSE